MKIGNKPVANLSESNGALMRFEAGNVTELEEVLNYHPVTVLGGPLEVVGLLFWLLIA